MNERSDQSLDLNILWNGMRRRWGWIVSAAVLFAVVSYAVSWSQPPLYDAAASLIASNTQVQDSTLGGALVKAPPLPEGVVNEALQSTQVIVPLLKKIQESPVILPDERARLVADLSKQLRQQRLRTVVLTSRLDFNGSGIYTLRARARTARSAQALANLTSNALVEWDRNRALENVRRAQAGFRAQMAQVDQQLATPTLSSIERQTLIARRAIVDSNLTQVRLLEDSVAGILSPLAEAVEPLQQTSPRPLRNAVLAGLLGLILATALIALLTILDRTVRHEEDLLPLGIPTLAVIPRLRQRDVLLSGIVRAAREAGLYEAVGFLRVNLVFVLHKQPHPVVMITSTAPGEGKSSLTATLADGFATSGQRVLIVDADLRRGTQDLLWKKFDETGEWRQLVGTGGARTTAQALADPDNVQVIRVEENVDVLPAGPGIQDSLSVFSQADLARALALWRQNYDVVLLDSAPLLALADGMVLGAYADAVLIVTEYGRTPVQAVRRTVQRAERAGLNLIGFVVNKSDAREGDSYGYSYSYNAREGAKV